MAIQFAHGIKPFDVKSCDDMVWLLGSCYDGNNNNNNNRQKFKYETNFL